MKGHNIKKCPKLPKQLNFISKIHCNNALSRTECYKCQILLPEAFREQTHTVHTLAVEHNIFRLEVSVDDALLVQVTQSHGNLCKVKTEEKNPRR